jgi:hypothetical protein
VPRVVRADEHVLPPPASVLAQMWLGPGADVARSWRRCGSVLAQMWLGPGSDAAHHPLCHHARWRVQSPTRPDERRVHCVVLCCAVHCNAVRCSVAQRSTAGSLQSSAMRSVRSRQRCCRQPASAVEWAQISACRCGSGLAWLRRRRVGLHCALICCRGRRRQKGAVGCWAHVLCFLRSKEGWSC